jgi:hypothetical protein
MGASTGESLDDGGEGLDEALTVEGAWTVYDLDEAALWSAFAEDPNYLTGSSYIERERLARLRCERRVQRIRYRRVKGVHG